MADQSEFEQIRAKLEALENRIKQLESDINKPAWPSYEEANKLFPELVKEISDPNLEVLIRETSLREWAEAAIGLDLEALAKIRSNISLNNWGLFVELALGEKGPWNRDQSRCAILKIAKMLEEVGEITIRSDDEPFFEYPYLKEPLKPVKRLDPTADAEYQRESQEIIRWQETTLRQAGTLPRQRNPGLAGNPI